ncbi:MAG: hypothetical protein A2521_01985 [Deltaproteobacteria bacterium RIFOXYD12_FULL_57_12]|nr:MAG: hypothetical protein A2521_01985 [Deltaproteobacteria bacterium RIFOXYD12_FULL_57_12]
MVFTIITIMTAGTTQDQGAGLGPTCQETTTPKRSGSKEETGSMTGAEATMTDATITGATMTDATMDEADDFGLPAATTEFTVN